MTPHLILTICMESINHKLLYIIMCVGDNFPFTAILNVSSKRNCLRMYENEKCQHYNICPIFPSPAYRCNHHKSEESKK